MGPAKKDTPVRILLIISVKTEWVVQNKVYLAISDNAANIKKTILEILRCNHLGCIVHTINLNIQDALKPAENIVTKESDIVSYFKRSEDTFINREMVSVKIKKIRSSKMEFRLSIIC